MEFYLFQRDRLKQVTPNADRWLEQRYGKNFKLRGKKMTLARMTICCFLLLGCASKNTNTYKDLELSRYENLQWTRITLDNAKDQVGIPDIQDSDAENNTVWIYTGGNPPSSRLTLLFDKANGHLLNATWFFRSYDKNADVKTLAEKYQFNLDKPIPNPNFFGVRKTYYTNNKKSMEMAVLSKEKAVEYISWIRK